MTAAAEADAAAALLAGLPQLAFAFALLLARIGSACMLLPLLGEAEVPATIRAALALLLVVLLLPGLREALPPAPSQPLAAAGMVVAEIVAGLFLGWLARLVMLALPLAGQFMALATNLASVIQPDPALGVQTAALGRLLSLAAPLLLVASGLYALPLRALAGSSAVLPAGRLLPAADTMASVLAGVAGMTALAVRLAAPYLLASLAWNVTLGLIGRIAPALPLSGLTGPLHVLGGLLLLALLLGLDQGAWREQAAAVLSALPGL